MRVNYAQGLRSFFITDDNFARNKDWEAILDRLIHLREVEKLNIGFIIQVDTLCHKLPNFVEKCARAGVRRVFIGLENINPDNLLGAKKRQNKITEYRKMLLAWKKVRDGHHLCGLHPRIPARHRRVDHARHRRDQARAAGRPARVFLSDTAAGLGGPPQALARRRAARPRHEQYDLNHICTTHPKNVARPVERGLPLAWQRYYTTEHIDHDLRSASRLSTRTPRNALFLITWFKGSIDFEHIHPLESGFLRLKSRRDRRPACRDRAGVALLSALLGRDGHEDRPVVGLYLRLRRKYLAIKHDPNRFDYTDLAMTPVRDDETLELFQSDAAAAYVNQERRTRETPCRRRGLTRSNRPSSISGCLSSHRECARPGGAADAASPRRRGHRISRLIAADAQSRDWPLADVR